MQKFIAASGFKQFHACEAEIFLQYKDLSTFVTYDKNESLLAKFNQEFDKNTHSKPQETLEFKMTKQKKSFVFDEINQEELNQEESTQEEAIQENEEDSFEIIKNDFFETQLAPVFFELNDINNAINQKLLFLILKST